MAKKKSARSWAGLPELKGMLQPIDKLLEDPENARIHPETNLEHIQKSLSGFTQTKNIVVHRFKRKRTYTVIAGNGTLRAARALGWTHIACSVFKGSDEEARAYAIMDNRSSDTSRFDMQGLTDRLEELAGSLEDLSLTGFTEQDLEDLRNGLWPDPVDPDSVGDHDPGDDTVLIRISGIDRNSSDEILKLVNDAIADTPYTAEAF